jgi:ketosteroid isomerase-like protein
MALFFVSLLPQFAPPSGFAFGHGFGLGLVFSAMSLVWLFGCSIAVATVGELLFTPRIRRASGAVAGVVLVILGVGLAAERFTPGHRVLPRQGGIVARMVYRNPDEWSFSQDHQPPRLAERGDAMNRINIEVIREMFRAVERRDPGIVDLWQRDVEFHWPPSLPYGRDVGGPRPDGATWERTWDPLQPTSAERSLDPRIVAASQDEVVVLWQQRGVNPGGERFEGEVLGLYRLRDGKLARAQMFYFDSAAVGSFLARAAESVKSRVHTR